MDLITIFSSFHTLTRIQFQTNKISLIWCVLASLPIIHTYVVMAHYSDNDSFSKSWRLFPMRMKRICLVGDVKAKQEDKFQN